MSFSFSFLLVSYNHEKYIARAIESCLNQDLTLCREIIICDDCSSDKTLEIAQKYQKQHPQLIKIISNPQNLGVIRNYENGFKNCSGDYVAILEGDDYWLPFKIATCHDMLQKYPDAPMLYHKYKILKNEKLKERKDYFYSETTTVSLKDMFEHTECGNFSACIYKRKSLLKYLDTFKQVKGGDAVLNVIILEDGDGLFLNEYLSVYNNHDNSIYYSHPFINQMTMVVSTIYQDSVFYKKEYKHLLDEKFQNILSVIRNEEKRLIKKIDKLRIQRTIFISTTIIFAILFLLSFIPRFF